MPPAADLIAQLTQLANNLAPLAVAWHFVLAVILLALLGNWRPRERTLGWFFALIAASVAMSAVVIGNPFNAVSFALLAVLLIVTSGRNVIATTPSWQRWLAAAFIIYGGLYPHFLHAPALAYIVAAPVGVIPCPSLAMITGLFLLANVQSRGALIVLTVWTAIYAAIGILHFSLWLDIGLAAASLALLLRGIVPIFRY